MLDLGAGEIGVDDQAGLAAEQVGSSPSALSSSQMAALTRLCQTMALATGCPVARSQRMVVSRWLVTPMAAMSAAVSFGRADRLAGDRELRRPDRLGIVLDEARRGQNLRELLLRSTRRGPRDRRRSPGWRWCLGRARGCTSRPWVQSRFQSVESLTRLPK